MTVINLSLKAVLLCSLDRFLLGNDEASADSFIISSQNSDHSSASSGHLANFNSIPGGSYKALSSAVFGVDDKEKLWPKIPLQKKQTARSVLYVSALPKVLAKSSLLMQNQSLLSISEWVFNQLRESQQHQLSCEPDHNPCNLASVAQLWSNFEIGTQRLGWLSFRLSEVGIAGWLQQSQTFCEKDHQLSQLFLNQSPLAPLSYSISSLFSKEFDSIKKNDACADIHVSLWQIQHTHARCCGLLRLWHEAQLINSEMSQSAPLPWLTNSYQLRGNTPQSWQLIQLLIETADDMFWIPYRWPLRQHILLLKRASLLCQAFDCFHRTCLGGFGRLSVTASEAERLRFQVWFGLVMATKNRLNVLLRNCLGEKAPIDL